MMLKIVWLAHLIYRSPNPNPDEKNTQEKRANIKNNNYKILNHIFCSLCAPLTRSDLTVTWGAHNKKTAQSHQKKTLCMW